MADEITVRTQRITRDQIAAAVGNNPRFIKLIELLTQDLSSALPAAIASLSSSIDGVELGVLGNRPSVERDVRPGFGILVDQDAAGYALRVDLQSLLLAVDSARLHREQALDVRAGSNVTIVRDAAGFIVSSSGGSGSPDDANTVIAGRVFGA